MRKAIASFYLASTILLFHSPAYAACPGSPIFGFSPQQAVGRHINQDRFRLNIVGVVGDTNFDGLKSAIPAFIFFYDPTSMHSTSVRIKPGQNQAALAAIDRIWHRFVPTVALQRRFQDESFDRLFAADERESAIFGIFVGIAIFIACLGLFGLASFTAERRTREIGIRKAFGARTRNIVGLLLWQFSMPVLVANLIAWPVAWYYLHHWVEGYAYRIGQAVVLDVWQGSREIIQQFATRIGASETLSHILPKSTWAPVGQSCSK